MKKVLCLILIIALLLAFSAGAFACKKTVEPTETTDKAALSLLAADAVFSEGREDKSEIATAFLSFLEIAELEDAEIVAVLNEIISNDNAGALAYALVDVKQGNYLLDHIESYRDALQLIAKAVSPEMAGKVFYVAAKKTGDDLPYSESDCEKLSALIFGQDLSFGSDFIDAVIGGETYTLNEKQVNTLMVTLVAGLRKAVGLSASAKQYLYTLASDALNAFSDEEVFTDELKDTLEENSTYFLSLLSVFLNGYDVWLSFAADYLDSADARFFMGFPYEREERVVYYGYSYDDWTATMITKEEYDAHAGDYDTYFPMEATVKGFTVNGEFIIISDEDAELADNVYRLNVAYQTYAALSEQAKADFRENVDLLLTALAEEQDFLAAILEKEPIEDTGVPGATFDEMIAALPDLATFDVTNGVDNEERTAAKGAIALVEKYLHGYLPKIY